MSEKYHTSKEEVFAMKHNCTVHPRGVADDSYTYFVQQAGNQSGPIKIGKSKQPYIRYRSLCSMSPVPLALLTLVSESCCAESSMHGRHSDNRLHGEWFKPTPRLLKDIDRITRKRWFNLSWGRTDSADFTDPPASSPIQYAAPKSEADFGRLLDCLPKDLEDRLIYRGAHMGSGRSNDTRISLEDLTGVPYSFWHESTNFDESLVCDDYSYGLVTYEALVGWLQNKAGRLRKDLDKESAIRGVTLWLENNSNGGIYFGRAELQYSTGVCLSIWDGLYEEQLKDERWYGERSKISYPRCSLTFVGGRSRTHDRSYCTTELLDWLHAL